MNHILVFTSEQVAGKQISQHLGLVRGNVIRSRHLGKDILAVFRMIIGGEISEYTKLMAESREQAIDRMVDEARELGADAIVDVRFTTSMIARGAAELLVFGTAVKFEANN
ncbi:YbjQ family protein [Colwellia sp. RSH04]|uniref:YbjQ family protein n=1 Tax=Colwellia sp. RSH04 TaxID=2305464 RepID=UPI000E57A828|nr:YbjQ family protein [Colwellia sp. RSH04]RHW76267.1 YbjQ family protein [Colwellia sp. RSH04]